LHPKRVVEVGCGTGALLRELHTQGCTVLGLEYAAAAIAVCHDRGLHVIRFDLEHETFTNLNKFDVAVSMEVAEHLPERVADRYIALLVSLADFVVFTAAHPGQGGRDHVNEQPPAYWIEKYKARGCALETETSNRWRKDWIASGQVRDWYTANLIVFRRS
jgi:cyclopropane fatty-acyl-phospholipid synthase-like methyltransferase